jgi:hypothetical protein
MFMKKISLFMLAIVASFGVMAQDTEQRPMRTEMSTQIRFGVKAGVNLATLEIDDDSPSNDVETNNKTSFHGGVFVNIPLAGMFRFQPELLFSGQGSKIQASNSPLPGTRNTEWDFRYISVPMMFQYQTTGGFLVEAGPHVNFLINARDEEDRDLKDLLDMKTLDYGIGAGIGYLSRIGLGVGARYNLGFANIYDADAGSNDDGKLKNRVLNIGLTYHFGANK